jgi:N-acetylglucosaminyl-diphospho-decaprenol L-rhamnosyltransferase
VIEQARQLSIDWELLVVDNASTDGSAAMVRHEFPEAILFANDDNAGFARANNQAFLHANGSYVLLLNPDTVVSQGALSKLLEILRGRPDAAAIGCRMVDGTGALLRWTGGDAPTLGTIASHFLFLGRLFPNNRFFRSIYLNGDPTTDLDVGWVSGACMLLRRDALGVSIFDERFFMYGEDIDLCLRLRTMSWKIVYSPRATIVHYDGSSLKRQSAGVDLNKLRNLRHIFAARHGNLQLAIYDGIVCLGFLARSVGFIAAGVARPRRGFQREAKRSIRYLAESIRAMLKTPRPGKNA